MSSDRFDIDVGVARSHIALHFGRRADIVAMITAVAFGRRIVKA
jgi:hypothetical protein